MLCPRCGTEWNLQQPACAHCGLQMRVPVRPQAPMHTPPTLPTSARPSAPFVGPLSPTSSSQHVPRSVRAVAAEHAQKAPPAMPVRASYPKSSSMDHQPLEMTLFTPGTLLHAGRYRLLKFIEMQEWSSQVFESTWSALDTQQPGNPLLVQEVMLPAGVEHNQQTLLHNVTTVLSSVRGRLPLPILRDAFSDQGRSCFVFEHIHGDSLLKLMRASNAVLAEHEVLEACLQISALLDVFVQHNPPLVHGLIRPEHIIRRHSDAQYTLINFSLIIAGGASHFVRGVERARLSPYSAPEMTQGILDTRTDLYALLASAYHVLIGNVPPQHEGMLSTQMLNARISPQFSAILARGLSVDPQQRYRSPAELHKDLQEIHTAKRNSLAAERLLANGQRLRARRQLVQQAASAQSQVIQLPTNQRRDVSQLLVPAPEELPPLQEGRDLRNAALWFVGLLLCLLPLLLGRGLL